MKRVLCMVLVLLSLLPLRVLAASDPSVDDVLTGANPSLTPQEQAGLTYGEQNATAGSAPVAGANGLITFPYGVNQISIVCAPLHVCDVALQPGEQVNSVNVGDNVRWSIEPALTGSGAEEVQHVIIKPREVGLDTSLVVATNRRAYYLRLRSHKTRYMPQVAFSYPEDAAVKFDLLKARQQREVKEKTIPQTTDYLPKLSFDYDVSGQAAWKPVRVYNDGARTVIEMPPSITQTEAPILLLVRKDGGLFSEAEEVLVNYSLQGHRYIVDTIFEKAVLVAGVGSHQDRVMIQRRK
uniref:P-type conjugative transfer protein TrbG n=1 Tax=Nitrospira cf. moscoviensis SBR1015 TaxID=96242 RepID=UPI000A394542|nr:P-type conjugative transfer protein TrbG [Nitrospira cf. moscoviensis SBR1015]